LITLIACGAGAGRASVRGGVICGLTSNAPTSHIVPSVSGRGWPHWSVSTSHYPLIGAA
jgi:hypothetical protein